MISDLKASWQEDGRGLNAGPPSEPEVNDPVRGAQRIDPVSDLPRSEPDIPMPAEAQGAPSTDGGSTDTGTPKTVIIDDNGTLNFYTISATFTGAV